MPKIRSRAEAAALGLKKYWTGKPCKNGHTDWRYTSSGQCATCHREAQARWDAKLARGRQDRIAGTVAVPLRVAPEDVDTLRDFAVALCLARGIDGSVNKE